MQDLKVKPSPITTCQEEPNFLSMVSLIILAALQESRLSGRAGKGQERVGVSQRPSRGKKSQQERGRDCSSAQILQTGFRPSARGGYTATSAV